MRGAVFGGRSRLRRRSSRRDELLRTWDKEEVIRLLLSEGHTDLDLQRFCSCVSNTLCLVTGQISNEELEVEETEKRGFEASILVCVGKALPRQSYTPYSGGSRFQRARCLSQKSRQSRLCF